MRFRIGLVFAFLLTLPGIFVIMMWALADKKGRNKSFGEILDMYASQFPDFTMQLKAIMLFLAGACILSIITVLYIGPGQNPLQKRLRLFVGALAALTAILLVIPLF